MAKLFREDTPSTLFTKRRVIFGVGVVLAIVLAVGTYMIIQRVNEPPSLAEQTAVSKKKLDTALAETTDQTEKANFYSAKIHLLEASGDSAGAIQVALDLVKLDPAQPSYYGQVARLYGIAGDATKAVEYYDKAIAACDALPESGEKTAKRQFYTDQLNAIRTTN